MPQKIQVERLLDEYDAFFIDAYGVLVSTEGALPGATDFIRELRARNKQFVVLTNDASRLPETLQQRYRRFGFDVELERIIPSGSLLSPYFERNDLAGAPSIVLGPRDSEAYVERAGGKLVAFDNEEARVVAICDDDGFDLREGLDQVITVLFRRFDRQQETHLVMPNPDLIYLRGPSAYGVTAGSLALVIEAALDLRFSERKLRFERLGKPHCPMFEEAQRRVGNTDKRRCVMLGDQLVTDIAGANGFGIDSVLLSTGITGTGSVGAKPTWLLEGFAG